ncbi:hypothetical protein [Urinicoccus timonensis]|uniref:hypothetical protein n=1 Tax=Urinicoccus timonensis TaxID=2024205 RepID=UPI000C081468|nr:hypothetical protein [Urinicoccus timonensis]
MTRQERDQIRQDNILWTVAGTYENLPQDRMLSRGGLVYRSALEGLIYKHYEGKKLLNFFRSQVYSRSHDQDLRVLAQLYFDYQLKDLMEGERPGAYAHRLAYLEDLKEKLKEKKDRTFQEELLYAYIQALGGGLQLEPYKEILRRLMRKSPLETGRAIQDLERIYRSLAWDQEEGPRRLPSFEKGQEEKSQAREDKTKEAKILPAKDKVKETESLEKYTVEAAEFTGVLLMDEEMQALEEAAGDLGQAQSPFDPKIHEKVIQHYGQASQERSQLLALEEKICQGIHQGIRLHRTKGHYLQDMKSSYYQSLAQDQEKKNLQAFQDRATIYRRNINQLKSLLKKTLLDQSQEESQRSRSGDLEAAWVWQEVILGNKQVFRNRLAQEPGQFTVDLLMDASGSQEDHQEDVAIQAYILAQALVALHIPTRVLGFHNLYNYLVIEEYRDYRDGIQENRQIFRYQATGSNRDGLALAYLYESMKKDPNRRSLLVVLSDGRPNDRIHLGLAADQRSPGLNYEDQEALEDTAQMVLNLRLKGIQVLGVFTGQEEDLDKEVKIYGRDFAYIKDMDRFSIIVGKFFKSFVERWR